MNYQLSFHYIKFKIEEQPMLFNLKSIVTVQPSAEPLQAAPIFKVACSEMGAALNSFTYSLMTNQQVIGHG